MVIPFKPWEEQLVYYLTMKEVELDEKYRSSPSSIKAEQDYKLVRDLIQSLYNGDI